MSSERFDTFAKSMASGTSRRTALKAMVATVAGGVLAAFGISRAEAGPVTCTGRLGRCVEDTECCSGTCLRIGGGRCRASGEGQTCNREFDCRRGLDCVSGTCQPTMNSTFVGATDF